MFEFYFDLLRILLFIIFINDHIHIHRIIATFHLAMHLATYLVVLVIYVEDILLGLTNKHIYLVKKITQYSSYTNIFSYSHNKDVFKMILIK
ncbi:hypothetical protein IEQ34_017948 [Dendrobium chrysotoxum]|uniref:Uncharacterized protein n=1 Tax=Dendrobium chrysotoxum TaxID=161865 RepID=A0AAV7GCP9_DENCH|nr:hypothetical protein IEQ34_017948 [Dendrobium chrysotoxum]